MPFAWTINPYRGCEFGCHYCYARYTHEFLDLGSGLEFERRIFAKTNAPELLREELRCYRDKGLPIALGTATDPYQPAERRFQITRRLLEVIAAFERLDLSVTTKSVLILRDLDLLRAIGRRHRLSVHITVTTPNPRLARLLEPKAPPPDQRFRAVCSLSQAGISVSVNVMPILPGLTDDATSLEELARRAAAAGARSLHGTVLFLKPSALRHFMPFLERTFPHLAERYWKLYSRSAYVGGGYRDGLASLMASLRRRYNLDRAERTESRGRTQLVLPLKPC